MKLLAISMCIACASVVVFGQDTAVRPQGGPDVMIRRNIAANGNRIGVQLVERAIVLHQPFWLTDRDLGAMVITAMGSKDEGRKLALTGVEFKTSSVVVSADEVIYHWATGETEPRGNVHIKPLPSR
jgi:hypothetical protein